MTMTSTGTAKLTLPSDTQIRITREFAAPKHLVYKAITTPQLIKRWWNAKRGEVTIAEIDLRPGGKWRQVMVTPNGMEVGFHGEYKEVVPNERVVSTEVFEGAPDPEDNGTLNTVTLSEKDGATFMEVLIDCPNPRDATRSSSPAWKPACRTPTTSSEELALSLS